LACETSKKAFLTGGAEIYTVVKQTIKVPT